MAEIVLDRVSKRFPDGTITLQEASFTIHDGEFFVLVGPSGCGKSTLLNMIVGLEELSAGEIRVDGRRLNGLDPKERNMAMVFQSYAIYPHMSVRENIAFPLRLAKLPKAEIDRRVEDAAAILELTPLLERKPASLSGGQRQRVAMGRAIVREPRAFLLDEPLSNLDARLRGQMRTEITRLHQRLGTTMIYVTHDQTEAMTLGERVAVLERGGVQQIGTPQELYNRPANLFVAGFIGTPGMNLFPAGVEDSRLVLPFGAIELPDETRRCLPAGCNRVIAGIRPEGFRCPDSGASSPTGLSFDAIVEVAEWLGSELYVYFDSLCSQTHLHARWPKELTGKLRDNGSIQAVARLDPANPVGKGAKIRLLLDSAKIQLFDGASGANLRPAA